MTTFFGKTNNATSAVADVAGINGTSDPVTFNVTTGEGSLFPASNFKITIDNEILLCTSRTGDALTCSRASEGTTIAAHTQNATVEHRITAATLTEYETLSKMQGMDYAADAGSTDAYAVTLAPAPTAYFTGMTVKFKANTANTGAATLNVNALGAKDVKKNYNTALETGDILANQLVAVIYDGTNFQMLSPSAALTAAANDGWITDSGTTWTYASSSTINVANGTLFQKGDRIKLTQTTAKYFVVTGVSGNVITVSGGTDYTVANAAITTQQYSHEANPLGYPGWFALSAPASYTGIDNGAGGAPTTSESRFSIVGRTLFFHLRGTGTKDGASVGFSFNPNMIPLQPANSTARTVLGSMYVNGPTIHHVGVVTYISATDWWCPSADNIVDNGALADFSVSVAYEI